MKQLLSQHKNCILVGLKDRAFLVESTPSPPSTGILELSKSKEESNFQKQKQLQPPRKDQAELNDITAVAVTSFITPGSSAETYFCAVARFDKSLSVYAISQRALFSTSPLPSKLPSIVYHTPKRISCLTFAKLSSGPDSNEFIQVLITGDLAGDSYAYNLLENGQRLLLGHTASMLTGVAILRTKEDFYCIATADRDEKIRISRFPESYVIEGYMLGHTKYVTAIDAAAASQESSLLVSCGGDKMIRLWNSETMQEMCHISTEDRDEIPSDIAITSSGHTVAVIFDGSNRIQFYNVKQEKGTLKVVPSHMVVCPSLPLVITFDCANKKLLVLMQEPDCMMCVEIDENDSVEVGYKVTHNDTFSVSLRELVAKESISLPETILEKDKEGKPVLQKEVETRGASGEEVPWKRPERIAVAKEKQKNRRRNRKEKKREKPVNGSHGEE